METFISGNSMAFYFGEVYGIFHEIKPIYFAEIYELEISRVGCKACRKICIYILGRRWPLNVCTGDYEMPPLRHLPSLLRAMSKAKGSTVVLE
jgi:hypothetical protein